MSKFIINGGQRLSGNVEISGSKNAALPIIFSTLITRGVSVLYGVPHISDVDVSLSIIKNLGATVFRDGEALYIDTGDLFYSLPDPRLVSSIRASSYLLGAALARFGVAHVQCFGGCNFDNRPIDMHLAAMRALGAVEDGLSLRAPQLRGADIAFDRISVGATVNAIILAATAKGVSRIYGYAREPHVISLAEFLNSCGADIRFYEDRVEIRGASLHGGVFRIIPDMIEAGTYIAASLATRSRISVSGVCSEHLSSFFDLLRSCGVSIEDNGGQICAEGTLVCGADILTSPYPGFPTDLHPQTVPLIASYYGGRVREGVWHSRFSYLSELEKFGVRFFRCGDTALICPSDIHSAKARVPDLRGGAALVIAALMAPGQSVIENSEILSRGYEDMPQKLRSLGADIYEIK